MTQTTYTFVVTNNCNYHVNYIAFGTTGKKCLSPPHDSNFVGHAASYQVLHTDIGGYPGFESVLFSVTDQKSFVNGASETFVFALEGPIDPRCIY